MKNKLLFFIIALIFAITAPQLHANTELERLQRGLTGLNQSLVETKKKLTSLAAALTKLKTKLKMLHDSDEISDDDLSDPEDED